MSGGCVGLQRTGVPFVVLLWPPGYELDPSGRVVLDPAGAVAAELGALVEVGGSELVVGSALEDALARSGAKETCPGLEYSFVSEAFTGP